MLHFPALRLKFKMMCMSNEIIQYIVCPEQHCKQIYSDKYFISVVVDCDIQEYVNYSYEYETIGVCFKHTKTTNV